MVRILLVSAVLFSFLPVSRAFNCSKEAEQIAIAEAQKEDKSMKTVKGTARTTDLESLNAHKVRDTQALYTTQVYDPQGSFIPYDVVVRKKDCSRVSVKADRVRAQKVEEEDPGALAP